MTCCAWGFGSNEILWAGGGFLLSEFSRYLHEVV